MTVRITLLERIIRYFKNNNVRNGAFKFFASFPEGSPVLATPGVWDGSDLAFSESGPVLVICCDDTDQARALKKLTGGMRPNPVHVVVGRITDLPLKENSLGGAWLYGMNPSVAEEDRPGRLIAEVSRCLKGSAEFFLGFEHPAHLSELERAIANLRVAWSFWGRGVSIRSFLDYYEDSGILHFVRRSRMDLSSLLSVHGAKDCLKVLLARKTLNIIGEKKGAHADSVSKKRPFIDELLVVLSAGTGLELERSDMVRLGSGESVVCDFGSAIVRIPQTESGLKRCRNNYDTLKKLKGLGLPVEYPEPLYEGSYLGQPFFAEKKLSGISLDLYDPSPEQQMLIEAKAKSLLEDSRIVVGRMDEGSFRELVESEITTMCAFLREGEKSLLRDCLEIMRKRFILSGLPLVLQHGDFKTSNFLCSAQGTLSGIIDWDLSRIPGLPLIDLITFLFWNRRQAHEIPVLEHSRGLALNPQADPEILSYCGTMGIPESCINLLAIMCIVKWSNDNYKNNIIESEEWYDELVMGCLRPSLVKAKQLMDARD